MKYGTNFKEFNAKLIEKYGDAFKNYKELPALNSTFSSPYGKNEKKQLKIENGQ